MRAGADPESTARAILSARRLPAAALSLSGPPISVADAYEVQRRFVNLWCAERNTSLGGYKISLTNSAAQLACNTDEPTYGVIFEDAIAASGATVVRNELFDPVIEPELVFIARAPIPLRASRSEIVERCDVAAGLEVPDSCLEGWFAELQVEAGAVIADNSLAGRLIVGDRVRAIDVELGAVSVQVWHEGREVAAGDARAVMGNPMTAVEWLLRKLPPETGPLPTGSLISAGTFTPPLGAVSGSYLARFETVGEVALVVTA